MTFKEFLRHKNRTGPEISSVIESLRKEMPELSDDVKLAVEYAITYSAFTTISLDHREGRKQECAKLYNQISTKCPNMKKSEKIKIIADKLRVKGDCIRVYLRELNAA
ncbi:MAG: hypothetical protein SPL22_06695 [Treponema sp.]|uniref:hypothetical protein n=1 Tax=Treponema sp. TaxID=166 RepID=UPI002A912778|nr:hypothetical protein [Treponema sp.]MDY6397404.1 hypothetical protein [Treponema sp.]